MLKRVNILDFPRRLSLKELLKVCLIFRSFQLGIPHKNVVYENRVTVNLVARGVFGTLSNIYDVAAF